MVYCVFKNICGIGREAKKDTILKKERKEERKNETERVVGCGGPLLIPVLGRQRQGDLCEFKDSLVYRVSSRTAKD